VSAIYNGNSGLTSNETRFSMNSGESGVKMCLDSDNYFGSTKFIQRFRLLFLGKEIVLVTQIELHNCTNLGRC